MVLVKAAMGIRASLFFKKQAKKSQDVLTGAGQGAILIERLING